jgi:uncharacterized protein YdhG (YjbR/CyaY superfamily)
LPKTDFKTIDEYIATHPPETQEILQRIRRPIHGAVPDAEEVISYQIPAVKFHGWLFYFSAYRTHYSLSCSPPFTIFEAFKEELSPYELSKCTIRFPLDRPVPVSLISDLAKFRAQENVAREGKKTKR